MIGNKFSGVSLLQFRDSSLMERRKYVYKSYAQRINIFTERGRIIAGWRVKKWHDPVSPYFSLAGK